jgi:CRP-like cAMP-binding protein
MNKLKKNEKLQEFCTHAKEITYNKGEIILRPEKKPDGVFYIKEGYIKAYTISEQGHENVLVIYKPGEIFPIRWLILDKRKNVFYQTLSKSVLCKIPKNEFINYLNSNPNNTTQFLEYVTSIFDVFVSRVENLEFTSAYSRLVSRLLFLRERFGIEKENGYIIDAPITHQDIANSINMTRETVSREFNQLEKKQLITHIHGKIFIPDIHRLQKELEIHTEKNYL